MLQYVDILVKAYLRGELVHGNCKKCAVGQIVKAALGYEDARWWEVMLAYAQGSQTLEDELYARYLETRTGLSIWDMHRIEGAFEGEEYVPGRERRRGAEDLSVRLERAALLISEREEAFAA